MALEASVLSGGALCVSVCRIHPLEWQHIKSTEAAMLHILFVITVLPVVLFLGFVLLASVVAEFFK
jgi:hypothetical protein